MTKQPAARFTHVLADFNGVTPARLRDASLLGGLLVAAAGAAGFTTIAAPMIKELPHGGLAGFLLLDGCHIAVHSFPDTGLLMLDVLAESASRGAKAVDVFARRLEVAASQSSCIERG